MLKINVALTVISLVVAVVIGLAITPEPTSPNTVKLTWIPQPETTWINVWEVSVAPGTFQAAHAVTGGVTNTVELSGTAGLIFQIQEYKLVNSRLELVTFFNTNPVPAVDTPTPTSETPQPSVTPTTPTPIKPKAHYYVPVITR